MNRPQWNREKVAKLLKAKGIIDLDSTKGALLGVRGYFQDSMGAIDQNDRGIYDDAMFLIAPGRFAAFNANTDPSKHREGIAVLQCGIWLYKLGLHGINRERETGIKAYTALVQAGQVEVLRDGGKRERGFFGINIHKGGVNGTSSLGCQTIIPAQWQEYIDDVKSVMKNQAVIQYCLIEAQG
jgi:lysozyme